MSQRRFSDEEIHQILAWASRPLPPAPEEATGDAPDPASEATPPGLTLAEFPEVAREAGIDPARIEAAALGAGGWGAWALPRWARAEEARLEDAITRARSLAVPPAPPGPTLPGETS